MCQILRRFSLTWMICSLIHNGTPKHLEVFPALRGASTSHSCVLTPSGTWDTALVSLSVWVDGETKLHCNSSPDPSDHGTRPLRHFTEFYDLRHCQAVVGLELPWEEKQPICLEGPFHTFWMVLATLFFPVNALRCAVLALQLPSPPTDDEGDFIFIHHEDVRLSQKADEVYTQLIKLLKDQHEVTVFPFLETFGLVWFFYISLGFINSIIPSLFLWRLLIFF